MKVIVTGALGHIGSALIRNPTLASEVSEMVLIDNLLTQRYSSLFTLPKGVTYRFLQGDVSARLNDEVLDGADFVIHLAGTIEPVASVEDPDGLFSNNLRITKHVVNQCAANHVPMVFVSSTSVYTPSGDLVDEDSSELYPASPYAQCKIQEESYVLEHLGVDESIVFRFGTIFGVSPGMRFQTAVSKFCWQVATGAPLEVWSTAEHQLRPYLEIGDAVDVVTTVIVKRILPGRVVNAVTCNASVSDVLEAIRACGRRFEIKYVDSPIMNTLSFEASTDYALALGLEFKGDLQTGVRETLAILGYLG